MVHLFIICVCQSLIWPDTLPCLFAIFASDNIFSGYVAVSESRQLMPCISQAVPFLGIPLLKKGNHIYDCTFV